MTKLRSIGAGLSGTFATNKALLTNASSMLGTTAATSLLGAGFWWLAARGLSRETVGVSSAAISAMTLLGFFATFGLGTLLMGELPRSRQGQRTLIKAALTVVFTAGAGLGLAFALIAPLFSAALEPLSSDWISAAVFALGVGLTGAVLVLDEVVIGLLRGGLQLSRNIVFAAVKFVLLIPIMAYVSQAGAGWVYGAWVVGIVCSFVVLLRYVRRRSDGSVRAKLGVLRSMRKSARAHYLFNTALEATNLALPILVLGLVSASANASFYIAWMIVGHLVIVPAALGTVLYPIGASEPDRMSQGLVLTLKLSFGFGVLANLMLLLLGEPLLSIFGEAYADQGTAPLQIMALGIFPMTIKALFVAVHRVERTLHVGLPYVWVGLLLELGGAAAGAVVAGLPGVAVGWLAAVLVQGVAMTPSVVRAIRDPLGEVDDALSDEEVASLEGLAERPMP